jgi:hypothetical protein
MIMKERTYDLQICSVQAKLGQSNEKEYSLLSKIFCRQWKSVRLGHTSSVIIIENFIEKKWIIDNNVSLYATLSSSS